jgi:hypothetical protein
MPCCSTTCPGLPRSITEVQRRHFLTLFEHGVGVVILHHALAGLQQWSTFEEITGLRMTVVCHHTLTNTT